MIQYKDFFGNVDLSQSIAPANHSATEAGAGVDTRGADGVAFVFAVGAGTSLSGTNHYELKVQHSDDNVAANYADVGDGDLAGVDGAVVAKVDAAADADQAYGASYLNSKRYVRCVAEEKGAGASLVVGAVVLRYRKQYP